MDDAFTIAAEKYGLTPERLDKLCAELYIVLAQYEPKEIRAVTELIENGTPVRSRNQGAGR